MDLDGLWDATVGDISEPVLANGPIRRARVCVVRSGGTIPTPTIIQRAEYGILVDQALRWHLTGHSGCWAVLTSVASLHRIDRNALGYSRCSRLERTRQVNGTLPYAFVPNKPTPNACELRTVIPVTTTQLLMARLPTTQSSKEVNTLMTVLRHLLRTF
ncbi:hypothetical protein L915_19245 [Phytophthora nicotianae]|uniref:Uncharacterized protein n=1 Tax=Phytophthora nicotianae TaxID=4792 RepID=W2FSW2_PHYNI|nr:hypothetical protein L915_19245 [Phytophthora nicotianae]